MRAFDAGNVVIPTGVRVKHPIHEDVRNVSRKSLPGHIPFSTIVRFHSLMHLEYHGMFVINLTYRRMNCHENSISGK